MQATDTLDLDSIEDVQTASLEVKHPTTGAPTGAVIELAGPQHPTHQKFRIELQRKIQRDMRRNGRTALADPQDAFDTDTDWLVLCTLGWSGITQGGQQLPFSTAAARAIYADPKKQWLRMQVRAALNEADRFISNSAKA
jgi:hypothetical protein